MPGNLSPSFRHGQYRLSCALRELFPAFKIITNARKSGGVVSPHTSSYLELDFWLPELRVAFEYQDEHHYTGAWYLQAHSDHEDFLERDDIKYQIMRDRGETLIPIPCWWDGSNESLIATIKLYCPRLFTDVVTTAAPISAIPPDKYFDEVGAIPDVGELMVASVVQDTNFDPTNWWMSEKYDGFRACWHPTTKKMFSRYGKEVKFHAAFASEMPIGGVFLDGELWFGRNTFKEALQFSNRQMGAVVWADLRFVVFDSPKVLTAPGQFPPSRPSSFEDRYREVVASVADSHPFITTAPQARCKHKKHMWDATNLILEHSGEGSVLRKPESIYTCGISDSLLKIKAYRDEEALVISQCSGGYILQLPTGVVFRSDPPISNEDLPTAGDVVTFAYRTYSTKHAEPTVPRIICRRPDLTWDEACRRSYSQQKSINVSAKVAFKSTNVRRPSGYWTAHESKNLRKLLDDFARSKNLDPLVPETWYSIRFNDFESKGWMKIFNDSFRKGLIDVYPDIGLQMHKFPQVTRGYWRNPDNRKHFLDRLAAKHRFDPQIAENWYSLTAKDIYAEKGGSRLMRYYGDFKTALLSTYPDIGLDAAQIKTSKTNWTDPENRRLFFDSVALKHGFHPLDLNGWNSVKASSLFEEKGGHAVLGFYSDSKWRALRDVYPELDKTVVL